MGSSSSKFRKHLQNGDEVAALNVYSNHSDLRKALDPNCSYGDGHQHETPLHYAARHGMKSLLRIFLYEHGGNPNKTNGHKHTALHCCCMERSPQFYPVQRRRYECLQMMLQWRGAELKDGDIEKVDMAAIDELDNTPLHYSASSGLKACVETMVSHGCPLFIENKENQTPCDCAESAGFNDIALYLESKMVFSTDANTDGIMEVTPEVGSEEYSGLRAQDLQEAKDQLLVETADMLSIPLFTAEALLRNYEWSREMLLDAWMADPLACCEKSGVAPPANIFSEKPEVAESLSSPTLSHPPSPFSDCDICTQCFPTFEEPVHMPCHQFCRQCWQEYLNVKIREGLVHDITCPAFGCSILVPVEVIESVVSRDMARRYLQFDIKAFVDSNPNIKWCPYPGCGRAVKFPESQDNASTGSTAQRPNNVPNDTSRAVDCGSGHHFCWECMGEAHEPCSCESLQKWQKEIADIRPETLDGTEMETETAANCLWLVTNSKPCPNCKSPIQKNEGCNHMKCSKCKYNFCRVCLDQWKCHNLTTPFTTRKFCKYDFCWVCLDQWKRHNSSTGGYFKCNRYEVVKKVEDSTKNVQAEAEETNTKMQELNKFVHYYTRFKNHENSYKLEQPLLKTAKEKMLKLAEAVTDLATARDETKFVEEAVHQLLKARRVLRYSYVYGYYLSGPPYRKLVFEFMQTELEEGTEILSQMVNRPYLRTPRKKIIEQSQICHRKRAEFITAISKGLVPPETPPGLRKKRRKFSMDTDDEDLRKAILASIEDFDPANPWIITAAGRHTNVAAMLDWPSDSDEEDDAPVPSTITPQQAKDLGPGPGICIRENCSRRRARNPRTSEYHNFCSRDCSRLHKLMRDEEESVQSIPEGVLDEQMDLLRALEMSRIQFLQEQGEANSRLPSSGEIPSGSQPGNRSAGRSHDTEIYTPVEKLDLEIRRLLELSSLTDVSEDSMRKPSDSSLPDTSTSSGEDKQTLPISRFGENQSTVVSRVPNKSVEDLYHPDCTDCQGLSPLMPHRHVIPAPKTEAAILDGDKEDLESLGAYGGNHVSGERTCDTQSGLSFDSELGSTVDDICVEGKILQKLLNTDKIHIPYQEIQPSGASNFGVIKDISIANILIDDTDKTRNFLTKDLTHLSEKTPPKPSEPAMVSMCGRGRGGLFAANTPGEDDKVFSLISPESDFEESSSSEVWGFRPQPAYIPTQERTPETDSSIDGCSYADLPNQNELYKYGDSTSEASPVIGHEIKSTNLIGHSEFESSSEPGRMSIVEMTKNLLQLTLDMQHTARSDTSESLNVEADTEHASILHSEVFCDGSPGAPRSGQSDVEGEITQGTLSSNSEINDGTDTITNRGHQENCEIIDLEDEPVTMEMENTVATATVDPLITEAREAILNDLEHEERSTYV